MRYSSSGTRVRISALLPVNISFTARFATLNNSETFQTCALQKLAFEVLEFLSASHSCAHYVTMFDQVHSKPPHTGMSGQKNHFLDFFVTLFLISFHAHGLQISALVELFTIKNHGFQEICIWLIKFEKLTKTQSQKIGKNVFRRELKK